MVALKSKSQNPVSVHCGKYLVKESFRNHCMNAHSGYRVNIRL